MGAWSPVASPFYRRCVLLPDATTLRQWALLHGAFEHLPTASDNLVPPWRPT